MPEFEKTSRPYPGVDDALLAAVVATEGLKDEAIKVRFSPDENMQDFKDNLRAAVRRNGLKLRYKFNKVDKSLTVYAEKLESGTEHEEEDESDKASLGIHFKSPE